MANTNEGGVLLRSVFDRLADGGPSHGSAGTVANEDSMLIAIRRDIENLLNTRQPPMPVGDEFNELSHSVVNYGLPDIDAMSAATSNDREEMCRLIRNVLATYEPRISDVRVRASTSPEVGAASCQFIIEGRLAMCDSLPVEFSTDVEFTTGRAAVRSVGN